MAFTLNPSFTSDLSKVWGLDENQLTAVRLTCEQKDLTKVKKTDLADSLFKVLSGLNPTYEAIRHFLNATSPKKAASKSSTDESSSAPVISLEVAGVPITAQAINTPPPTSPSKATAAKETLEVTQTAPKAVKPANQATDSTAKKAPAAAAAAGSNEGPKKICLKYKKGICPFGLSGKSSSDGSKCQDAHPKKCSAFKKYAWHQGGCSNRRCPKLHPIVCQASLKGWVCRKADCKLLHPTGFPKRDELPQGDRRNQQLPPRMQSQGQQRTTGPVVPALSSTRPFPQPPPASAPQHAPQASAQQLAQASAPPFVPSAAPGGAPAAAPAVAAASTNSFLEWRMQQMQYTIAQSQNVQQQILQQLQQLQQHRVPPPPGFNQQIMTPLQGFNQKPVVPMPGTFQS